MMLAAGILAAASCTDFDDYNEAVADANPAGDMTLWQNIVANPNLSDFKSLVEKTGFNAKLDGSQNFTVWAPLNNQFNVNDYAQMDSAELMRKFVLNQVSAFSYGSKGNKEKIRALMLNDKSYDFVTTDGLTFDGIEMESTDLPASNGLLHTLKGAAAFYPNLSEFILDSVQAKALGYDSLSAYFLSKNVEYIDPVNSVKGPFVNGEVTYIEKVMVEYNTLMNRIGARLANEDSLYTVIVPNNEAWGKAYKRYRSCFNYLPTVNAAKFEMQEGEYKPLDNPNSDAKNRVSKTVDVKEWQDSLAYENITNYLCYNQNEPYNVWLKGEKSRLGNDTLYTVARVPVFGENRDQRVKLSGAQEIYANHVVQRLQMSNGEFVIVDTLATKAWETYVPELVYPASSTLYQASALSGYSREISVKQPDPTKVNLEYKQELKYAYVQPNDEYSKPELYIYLPEVESTTYELYCVFVPADVDRATTTYVDMRPNRVIFTMSYCDADGQVVDHKFLDESEENVNAYQELFPTLKDNNTNHDAFRGYTNDVSKVDTLYIGEFTFPVSYFGLSDLKSKNKTYVCPYLKVSSPFSATRGEPKDYYTRDLRIAAIILKPKEMVKSQN